jgi:secreted trypsin-like serine protease
MRRITGFLAAALAVGLLSALPASAIVHGSLDGDAHPYVGLLGVHKGPDTIRCSGTLVSPTVFVTAGHCTDGATGPVAVWLQPALTEGAAPVLGTAYTDPLFDPAAFWLHDVGVVVLDAPVDLPRYGILPAPHALDGLKVGAQTTFTTVGYGAQRLFPDKGASSAKDVALPVRMVAHPQLVSIANPSLGPQSLVLSNNASTGGTCNGDSGGPNLLGDSDVVVAVSSYVKGQTCGGVAGAFRLDQPAVLDWIDGFLQP